MGLFVRLLRACGVGRNSWKTYMYTSCPFSEKYLATIGKIAWFLKADGRAIGFCHLQIIANL
jgi:hypothetical protein